LNVLLPALIIFKSALLKHLEGEHKPIEDAIYNCILDQKKRFRLSLLANDSPAIDLLLHIVRSDFGLQRQKDLIKLYCQRSQETDSEQHADLILLAQEPPEIEDIAEDGSARTFFMIHGRQLINFMPDFISRNGGSTEDSDQKCYKHVLSDYLC
jgi:hypothetical protein